MKKTYYQYAGVYTFTYFSLAAFLPYLAGHLGDLGFNWNQIGVITALGSFAGLIARPLMGIISDKTRNSRRVITTLLMVSTLFAIGLMFTKSYLSIAALYTAMLFFMSPVNTLIDATALNSKLGFGSLRQWGAYGFAFGSLITGFVAGKLGIQIIFLIFVISNIIAIMTFRTINIHERKKTLSTFKGLGTLIRNKRYILAILTAIFMHGTITANNTYFVGLYTGVGGTFAGVGLAFFLFASSEAPFMKISDWILKKTKIENLMLVAIAVSTVKLFWYSTSPSPMMLIGTFLVHGLSTGFYIVASVRFISENTRSELTATALSIYASLGTGLSTVLFNYIGGVVAYNYGVSGTYKLFGACTIVAFVMVLIIKRVKPVNKEGKIEKDEEELA